MNRSEAYQLLVSELESISENPVTFYNQHSETKYQSEKTSESGKLYSIEVCVSKINLNKYIFKGNIHDNNTSKFTLLEESIEVEV